MVVEFSIMPVGVGESLSEAVAPVIGLIDESGLAYDRDKLLERFSRVYLVIKIDERKGWAEQITGKIKSVERKLGKRLRD
ncbi:MAG: thiamine-binding protein [Planctomycetota bacterium]|jgi:uncharacterized protein YqgV (UPF0045/DUF77 family)